MLELLSSFKIQIVRTSIRSDELYRVSSAIPSSVVGVNVSNSGSVTTISGQKLYQIGPKSEIDPLLQVLAFVFTHASEISPPILFEGMAQQAPALLSESGSVAAQIVFEDVT